MKYIQIKEDKNINVINGCIYMITNLINNKKYIGKTCDFRRRILEHFRAYKNEFNHNKSLLSDAIQEYGENNFEIEILEINSDNDKLNQLEKYYIDLLSTNDFEKGYNIASGGDGYIGREKFNKENIEKIIYDLKYSDISMGDIARQMNVNPSVISLINRGYTYKKDNENYPLRTINYSCIGVHKELYCKIVKDLQNNNLSINDISKKYNIDKSVVCNINHGKYCYRNAYYKECYNGEYPIRNNKNKKLQTDFNKIFYEILFTNKSIIQIEKDFKIPFNGIRYIALGKRRKELTKEYKLPLRKHIEYNQKIWNNLNKEV